VVVPDLLGLTVPEAEQVVREYPLPEYSDSRIGAAN
jgi:hypothetical protein